MAADGLTKPLLGPKHQAFVSLLGMEDRTIKKGQIRTGP